MKMGAKLRGGESEYPYFGQGPGCRVTSASRQHLAILRRRRSLLESIHAALQKYTTWTPHANKYTAYTPHAVENPAITAHAKRKLTYIVCLRINNKKL